MKEQEPQKVIVTNVQMEFFSMVIFMIKWVVAGIPAAIILFLIGLTVSVALGFIGAVFLIFMSFMVMLLVTLLIA